VLLTPHFHVREFDCHDGSPVPPHAYDDLEQLCHQLLEPLRRRYGPVVVLSGYRPPAYNSQVGGAPQSFHIYRRGRWGTAADVRAARGRPADWYRELDRLGAGGLGSYTDHVHVDNRHGHARW
jgi:uncharacterized protein YcbK (DUF882 family)